MTIKILSPQLANQIAAGEVVERPASVVKELVENSLDAGANHIQIDIENGGASLIRIRDNGSGIAKHDLTLALARHATSKISDLDDLENILSLGFRGEALASISSVSRLTLTSRTIEQKEAWQVYAQGREMETTIKPASHPVGTTVEVANLFFNTPARRKFLRSDKTEFSHIDEVIRRIALAKFNIAFTLTHNNKIIRQYRAASDLSQQLKRVAAICGNDFVQHALRIDWKHGDLHLSGWVADPNFSRNQNDLAYSYINGRMVRDKVILHAIRQAYAEYLSVDRYPAFILFIDLNPQEVDVNVHPTKHEVRFHQQRLIHDFIVQGISHALANYFQPNLPQSNEVQETSPAWQYKPNRLAAGQNIFIQDAKLTEKEKDHSQKQPENRPHFSSSPTSFPSAPLVSAKKISQSPSKIERDCYQELLRTPPVIQMDNGDHTGEEMSTKVSEQKFQIAPDTNNLNTTNNNVLRAVALVNQKALLLQRQRDFYLLDIAKLQRLNIRLSLQKNSANQQPLLIPVVFRLTETQFEQWKAKQDLFQQSGFEFVENSAQRRLTLNRIPLSLRNQNMQHLVISLLSSNYTGFTEFLSELANSLTLKAIDTLADAVMLLSETEQQLTKETEPLLQNLLYLINWDSLLAQL
ncbi:DNA mismatch repair endonuclease MutL [Rodentibacter caecimuris]|uniref:DNA mismatch repair protein MutL n=1 Tax=Rodentibacter caecimuris TaxID=1796644 RepID=A0ABX3KYT1_9PAST|nr:DNA mismatch repair protein MutL [Rodentibacter heylii]